jgi:hypothetical protein
MIRVVREQERMIEELPFPETFPPYARALSDPEQCLWVQVYRPLGEANERWRVLDADGMLLTAVTLPTGLTVS